MSCVSNSNEINELNSSNSDYYKLFHFEPKGKVTYQFYHEYGFTDKIYHLITIIKPNSNPNYEYKLPLDNKVTKKLKKINIQKFIPNKPIIFSIDYKINSDVTIKAEQFYLKNSDLNIEVQNGSYNIEINENIEIIKIYDADKGIEYIEMKK